MERSSVAAVNEADSVRTSIDSIPSTVADLRRRRTRGRCVCSVLAGQAYPMASIDLRLVKDFKVGVRRSQLRRPVLSELLVVNRQDS